MRSPLDVIAEEDAVRDAEELAALEAAPKSEPRPTLTPLAPRLGTVLDATIKRVERRAEGREKPIPLPWPSLAVHFAGGLWPGLHVLTKGTGVGGTQLALEAMIHAARLGTPGLYLGLEMGTFDVGVRALGLDGGAPWSALWTGGAGPAYLDRARAAVPRLADLPLHIEASRPHGFAPSAVVHAVEAMRVEYPQSDGPGSRPLFVVVDFLQLLGDEPGESEDVRIRIGRAAYVLRDLVSRLDVAILCISSVAREKYKALEALRDQAALSWDEDPDGRPINRRVLNAESIIGLGKETGDIEYAADSVSVVAKVPETFDAHGVGVVFATAKGRATGATWSPLRFTGHRYLEPEDRGGRMVEAWRDASEKRERAKVEKREAKQTAKVEHLERDADAIRQYVAAHPGCTVREARVNAVGDQGRRWAPAVALLRDELVETKAGRRSELRIVARASRVESAEDKP